MPHNKFEREEDEIPPQSYREAYRENHIDFEITNIVWEEDHIRRVSGERPEIETAVTESVAEKRERLERVNLEYLINQQADEIREYEELDNEIRFEYKAPDIAVDTSGRFVEHQIVGGSVVRQKIGEDPIEVDISGVCREPIARRLDELRNAKFGTIISKRLPGGSLDVQFASTSTSPLDSGGAVALSDNDAEFLYNYEMSAVEILAFESDDETYETPLPSVSES